MTDYTALALAARARVRAALRSAEEAHRALRVRAEAAAVLNG